MAAGQAGRVETRRCGLCGTRIASAVLESSARDLLIERAPGGRGTLAIQLALALFAPGFPTVPVVAPSRLGHYGEHVCPKAARAFSAAAFDRKRR